MTEESASRYLFERKLDEWAKAAEEAVEKVYQAAVERLGPKTEATGACVPTQAEMDLRGLFGGMRALTEQEINAIQMRQLAGAMNVYGRTSSFQSAMGNPLYSALGSAGAVTFPWLATPASR